MAKATEPMEFTAVIRKGERFFVALCPEVDVVSQGSSVEEALENLKEAVALYLEEMGPPKRAAGSTFVTRFALQDAKAS